MSDPTFYNRPYCAFLSHAHVDGNAADALDAWCSRAAGKVWFDKRELTTGLVADRLVDAIHQCQAAVVILSKSSLASGWVEFELQTCVAHQRKFKDFRIVPIRIDDSPPPRALEASAWITAPGGLLTPAIGTTLLTALVGQSTDVSRVGDVPVYLSRGSRPREVDAGRQVAARLKNNHRLRPVGDAPGHRNMDPARIKAIMLSCGGFVGVIADRGEGQPPKSLVRELLFAQELGLPALAVIEESVCHLVPVGELTRAIVVQSISDGQAHVNDAIEDFAESLKKPEKPAYVFVGHQFKGDAATWPLIKRCVEVVSGIPCIQGDELHSNPVTGETAQEQIIALIRGASMCIFDITDERLNTCIEAGIAIGADVERRLISGGPRRSPTPYMFRTREVLFYSNETEMLALMSELVQPLRRSIHQE